MNTSWTKYGLGACALAALAGGSVAQVKKSGAEKTLIGINLYDTGVKVVSIYGSPDEIQAVSIGGANTAGPTGGGQGFGGRGGGGDAGGGASPQTSPGALPPPGMSTTPFGFGDDMLRQASTPGGPNKGQDGDMGGGRGAPMGGPGGPGMPGGMPPGAGAPGGTPNLGGGASESTKYTRWVYNRQGSKYGFIIDKMGRVVQIEAIGMQNNRVKTAKGLGFGATFAQVIKTYGNPDGYEVGGDTILVKYLVNRKVAFRLSRLGAKKPHVVTGIVVAAGKV